MVETDTERQLRLVTDFVSQGVRRILDIANEAIADSGATSESLNPFLRQFSDTIGQILIRLDELNGIQSDTGATPLPENRGAVVGSISASLLQALDDLLAAAQLAKLRAASIHPLADQCDADGDGTEKNATRRAEEVTARLHDDVVALRSTVTKTIATVRNGPDMANGTPDRKHTPGYRSGPAESVEQESDVTSSGEMLGSDSASRVPGAANDPRHSGHPVAAEPVSEHDDRVNSYTGIENRPGLESGDTRRHANSSGGTTEIAHRSADHKSRPLNRGSDGIFWGLLVVVVLCPLPFAAVLPWSQGALACATVILLLAWSVQTAVRTTDPPISLREVRWIALPFLLVAVWAALQGSPITPEAWHHPLWRAAADSIEIPIAGSVSLDPIVTGSALALLLSYAGIFWLSLQLCHDPGRARLALRAVTVASLIFATYGFIAQISDNQAMLLSSNITQEQALTSTFVNRNNFATYAGLGLICTTGLLFRHFGRSLQSSGRKRKLFWLLADDLPGWGVVIVVAWFMLVTAVLLTFSRGGFVSSALGLCALLIVFGLGAAISKRQMAMIGIPVFVIGLSFFLFSGEVTSQRLARTTIDSEGRFKLYESTIDGIAGAPWKGTGYGTFYDSFRLVRDQSADRNYARAHNTYLENALELGLPAASVLVLTILVMVGQCAVGAGRSDRGVIYAGVGIGATVLVGSHALVDFSLQIPAVAVTYMFVMGAAVAQSRRVD